jgi:hypothetical protein
MVAAEIALDVSAPAIESEGEGDQRPGLPPPTGMLALIDSYAHDKTVDVEKFKAILEMRWQMEAREAEKEFNAAKGRILKDLAGVKIVKNKWVQYPVEKNNPKSALYDAFKYAPLEEIDKVLRPLLSREEMDLSYSDVPQADGRIMIRGRLKHLPGGHFEDSFMAAPLDTSGGKNNVQAVGSSNSYLRRYVACNIFNIVVVGDDNDGNAPDTKLSEEQLEDIRAMLLQIRDIEVDGEILSGEARLLRFMKVEALEEISAQQHRKAVRVLEGQIAKETRNADPAS